MAGEKQTLINENKNYTQMIWITKNTKLKERILKFIPHVSHFNYETISKASSEKIKNIF